VYLARYTAEIKGIFILSNARPHLIGLDNEKFDVRIKCALLFDDYDSQINMTLAKMAPWLLDSVLQNHGSMDSPQGSPKGSHEEVKKSVDLADDNSPHMGFSFSMPVYTVFLPALYAMLTAMGMDTGQANFQVDGVVVLKLSVFKVKRKPIVIPPDLPEILVPSLVPSMDSLSLNDSNSSATLTDLKKEREDEQAPPKPAVPEVEEDPGTLWFNCNYDIAFEVEKDAHKVVVQSADLLHVGYGSK
jgi:hypothetical protein